MCRRSAQPRRAPCSASSPACRSTSASEPREQYSAVQRRLQRRQHRLSLHCCQARVVGWDAARRRAAQACGAPLQRTRDQRGRLEADANQLHHIGVRYRGRDGGLLQAGGQAGRQAGRQVGGQAGGHVGRQAAVDCARRWARALRSRLFGLVRTDNQSPYHPQQQLRALSTPRMAGADSVASCSPSPSPPVGSSSTLTATSVSCSRAR